MNEDTWREAQINGFFQNLTFRFRTASDADLQLASGFNEFRYFSPKETRLSYVLRDLLDPQGAHGQGEMFLKRFLHAIGLGHLMAFERSDCQDLGIGIWNDKSEATMAILDMDIWRRR